MTPLVLAENIIVFTSAGSFCGLDHTWYLLVSPLLFSYFKIRISQLTKRV